MKKALLLLFIATGLLPRLQAQTPSPDLQFEERVFNFGNILEKNGKVSHTFVFKNTGTTPVVISDIQSGCGCIGQVHSKVAVKPGAKGQVTVTFDPHYQSGFFSKEVVVLSNGGKNYNRIWVEGTVTPMEHPIENDYPYSFGSGLHLRLKVMAFGYVKPGETKQMQLHYANDTDQEMTLSFVTGSKVAGLHFTNPGKIGPKEKGVVTFSYTIPQKSVEDIIIPIYPYVNHKKLSEKLEIKVLNTAKPARPTSAISTP